MKRTLKVCLAMGGGVSLGSFSGAALTESLKLLILFGKDEDGKPYDKVIVDGASGASAGAMALSIMIKTLMDYEVMIDILNKVPGREPITKDTVLKDLTSKYGNIPETKKEDLIALEVAEKVQEQIWVKELTIERLFGKTIDKNYQYNVDGSFGLLDRNSLLDIAKTYIVGKQNVSQEKIRVLDNKRIVFACSITNASPMPTIIASTDHDEDCNHIEENALNSTASFNHTELRVIDFIFDGTKKKSLDNWLVFKPNSTDASNPMEMSLSEPKSWSVLTATVMACGAFPIAFDPVILERYEEEYLKGWPFTDGRATNNFAYVDGGTFNNEPIKEAFKIGAFHDF